MPDGAYIIPDRGCFILDCTYIIPDGAYIIFDCAYFIPDDVNITLAGGSFGYKKAPFFEEAFCF